MTALNQLFEILHSSKEANQRSLDQANRTIYPVLGTVCKVNTDRTVHIADPANPRIESKALRRINVSPNVDPPSVQVGTTVLCFFVDGLFNNGWFLVCENATNPPQEKPDSYKDNWEFYPGSKRQEIEKSTHYKIGEDVLIEADRNIVIKTKAGASISLIGGVAVLGDAYGNEVIVGGLSGGLGQPSDIVLNILTSDVRINLQGKKLEIVNANDVQINGKYITVEGHLDNDGDIATSRGY